MAEQFSNYPSTTINGAITAGANSVVVNSTTGFPNAGNFRILLDQNELAEVTSVAGNTWTITRAVEALSGVQVAQPHSNGAPVVLVLTAGALSAAFARIDQTTTFAGAVTVTPDLTLGARLLFSTAAGKIVPGATSLSLRDSTDTFDNFKVVDAGSATVRNGLTVSAGGLTVTAGGLTVSAGGLIVTAGGLTVSASGAAITGNSTVTGTLGVTSDLTAQARLLFSTATSKIVPGATSLSHRNNADSADNLLISDAGIITLRNAISIPPSAGGAVAGSNYGSVPIKISEQVVSGATASITFSSIPQGFRHLLLIWRARSDNAAAQILNMQVNGDAGANYSQQVTTYTGATIATAQSAGLTSGRVGVISDSAQSVQSSGDIWIRDYAVSLNHMAESRNARNDVTAFGGEMAIVRHGGAPNVISSITLAPAAGNFALATFTLYGVP